MENVDLERRAICKGLGLASLLLLTPRPAIAGVALVAPNLNDLQWEIMESLVNERFLNKNGGRKVSRENEFTSYIDWIDYTSKGTKHQIGIDLQLSNIQPPYIFGITTIFDNIEVTDAPLVQNSRTYAASSGLDIVDIHLQNVDMSLDNRPKNPSYARLRPGRLELTFSSGGLKILPDSGRWQKALSTGTSLYGEVLMFLNKLHHNQQPVEGSIERMVSYAVTLYNLIPPKPLPPIPPGNLIMT